MICGDHGAVIVDVLMLGHGPCSNKCDQKARVVGGHTRLSTFGLDMRRKLASDRPLGMHRRPIDSDILCLVVDQRAARAHICIFQGFTGYPI